MTSLLEKARAAVLPDRKPPEVDPITQLAKLEARRAEIGAATDRLLLMLSSVQKETSEAYRAFVSACESESEDEEAIRAKMDQWLAVAPKWEHAQREFLSLTAAKNFGSVMTRFQAEYPSARDVLLRAAEYRLSEAKERHADVLSAARQRLVPEGFDLDQVAADPQVRRAAGRISHLETVKRRVQNEPLESVWRQMASQLLR
jgi:hypothetical protein